MACESNPMEAKRLREAFKNTAERDIDPDAIKCTHVWVFGQAIGSNRSQWLSLEKDGVAVACIEINNATLKRLKREYENWRQIGSGSKGYF